jgi:hypothetical protein
MTVATYSPTLTTDVTKIWRKVQTDVQQGLNFSSEEWEQMEDLKQFKVDWTTREILVPLDITEGYGIASIPEGGYEARPSSPAPQELSLSWVLFNGRFTITKTAKWIRDKSPNAMIEDQLRYQAMKKVQDLGRHFADYFYGMSTAYLCQTSTAASQSSGAYTIYNGYGQSTISDKTWLTNLFKVGDYVALVRSAALVASAIGVITATTPGTPSISVTWAGTVTSVAGDYIVKANSLENATLTAGTDYNKGMVGLVDAMVTASVHGLSSSTDANWAPQVADTSGGRLTGIRLRKAAQTIKNKGGGVMDKVYIAQGVERDMIALTQAAVRYSDPNAMEMDGSVKYGKVKFFSSQRVPNGWALPVVSKSIRRMTLLPKPDGTPVFDDMEKIADRSAYVGGIDFPCAIVHLNRANTGYFNGLAES